MARPLPLSLLIAVAALAVGVQPAAAAAAGADSDGAAPFSGTARRSLAVATAGAAADGEASAAERDRPSVNGCIMRHVTFGSPDSKTFSQNGEDGVLDALLHTCGLARDKTYVEFGTENGVEINTRLLRERHGWTGLLMDGGYEIAALNLHKHFMRADNIVSLFERYNVSKDRLDLLSVDLDFNDFYITREILQAGYRPRVLVAEINRNFPSHMAFTVAHDPNGRWQGSYYFGVSPLAYVRLLHGYGYSVVYIDKEGVNLFAVCDDLLDHGRRFPVPLQRFYHNHAQIHPIKSDLEVQLPGNGDEREWVYVPAGLDPTRSDWEAQLQRVRLRVRPATALIWEHVGKQGDA